MHGYTGRCLWCWIIFCLNYLTQGNRHKIAAILWTFSYEISWTKVFTFYSNLIETCSKAPVHNKSTLVQAMAWCRLWAVWDCNINLRPLHKRIPRSEEWQHRETKTVCELVDFYQASFIFYTNNYEIRKTKYTEIINPHMLRYCHAVYRTCPRCYSYIHICMHIKWKLKQGFSGCRLN